MPKAKAEEKTLFIKIDTKLLDAIDSERKRLKLTRKKFVEEVLKEHFAQTFYMRVGEERKSGS